MVSEEKECVRVQKQPVRIRFSKTGNLKYISHLDLNRTMQRIIIRAKIPVWYTEGFNPKPKLVFASPLSLGVESVCEYMDIRLVSPMSFSEIKERLAQQMPQGLTVLDVYEPQNKFGEIGYSAYEIVIKGNALAKETRKQVYDLLTTSPLMVLKKTKSGEKEVDVIPFIYACDVADDEKSGELRIDTILSSDSERYLNPEYLVGALQDHLKIFSGDELHEWYRITRNEMFLSDGKTIFC